MIEEIRDSFVKELQSIREKNDKLIVLISDSGSTSRIAPFLNEYPESVINVGIAEQNLVGVAAGMSIAGYIPVTANASCFLLGRSNEQVKVDVCYNNANVKLIGLNPGFAYGSLGATHHNLDDISSMLSFGNIEIFAPSDPIETRQIVNYAINKKGPVYIRLDSFKASNIHDVNYKFQPGDSVIIKEGSDVSIVCLGTIVHEAIEAEIELGKLGIKAEIISMASIRPFNPKKLIDSITKTGHVITVEENSLHGGIGTIVESVIFENNIDCKIRKIGVPIGEFAQASPRGDIKRGYDIDSRGIISNIKDILGK